MTSTELQADNAAGGPDDIDPGNKKTGEEYGYCQCGKCHLASGITLGEEEKYCCRATPFDKFGEDCLCITDHPDFAAGVLHKTPLCIAFIKDKYSPKSKLEKAKKPKPPPGENFVKLYDVNL